jgi:hypothetical protein
MEYRRYEVWRGGVLIGTTDLEVIVEPGARAAGVFHPMPVYASVLSTFALYGRAASTGDDRLLREFVHQRDGLRLQVRRDGVPLDARVDLISRWELRKFMVHVSSRDERFWRWRLRSSRTGSRHAESEQ